MPSANAAATTSNTKNVIKLRRRAIARASGRRRLPRRSAAADSKARRALVCEPAREDVECDAFERRLAEARRTESRRDPTDFFKPAAGVELGGELEVVVGKQRPRTRRSGFAGDAALLKPASHALLPGRRPRQPTTSIGRPTCSATGVQMSVATSGASMLTTSAYRAPRWLRSRFG